jgi:hypothetical protein
MGLGRRLRFNRDLAVIEIHRRAALKSQGGAIALTRIPGIVLMPAEKGRVLYFSTNKPLQALEFRVPELPDRDRPAIRWVLLSIP